MEGVISCCFFCEPWLGDWYYIPAAGSGASSIIPVPCVSPNRGICCCCLWRGAGSGGRVGVCWGSVGRVGAMRELALGGILRH